MQHQGPGLCGYWFQKKMCIVKLHCTRLLKCTQKAHKIQKKWIKPLLNPQNFCGMRKSTYNPNASIFLTRCKIAIICKVQTSQINLSWGFAVLPFLTRKIDIIIFGQNPVMPAIVLDEGSPVVVIQQGLQRGGDPKRGAKTCIAS